MTGSPSLGKLSYNISTEKFQAIQKSDLSESLANEKTAESAESICAMKRRFKNDFPAILSRIVLRTSLAVHASRQ